MGHSLIFASTHKIREMVFNQIFRRESLCKCFIQISCGYYHSLSLTNTSQSYSFGANSYGQLGLGDTNHRNIPQKVDFSDLKLVHNSTFLVKLYFILFSLKAI